MQLRAAETQLAQLRLQKSAIPEELLEKQADARARELAQVVDGFDGEWQRCKQMNADIDQKIAATECRLHELVYQ